MKTNLNNYKFDTSKPDEAKAYHALCATLKAAGYRDRWMNTYAATAGANRDHNGSEAVELDPTFLFSNQWNEAGTGTRRLFDWYEGIYPNTKIKAGHWLELTPEMVAIRESTKVCGYCGAHHHGDAEFCNKCLGNEYLKESELYLLRLLPVAEHHPKRTQLTEEEAAEQTPLYNAAQGLGVAARDGAAKTKNRQRVAALVPDATEKGAQLLRNAQTQTDAFTWLLDHGVNMLDNVIFYDHTQRFGFGWRTALTSSEESKLLDILVDFPFDYDIDRRGR